MTVRVLLVTLVATLGLDLSGLASWADSSRDWVAARMPEWPVLGQESRTQPAPEAVVEGSPGRDDLAFEAAIEGMTSEFRTDLASSARETSTLAEVEVVKDSRLDRITEAVRMTRRAVDAWSEIIQPSVEPSPAVGEADSF